MPIRHYFTLSLEVEEDAPILEELREEADTDCERLKLAIRGAVEEYGVIADLTCANERHVG